MKEGEIHELHAVPYSGTARTVHQTDEHGTFIFGCAFGSTGEILEHLFEYYGDQLAVSGDLKTVAAP